MPKGLRKRKSMAVSSLNKEPLQRAIQLSSHKQVALNNKGTHVLQQGHWNKHHLCFCLLARLFQPTRASLQPGSWGAQGHSSDPECPAHPRLPEHTGKFKQTASEALQGTHLPRSRLHWTGQTRPLPPCASSCCVQEPRGPQGKGSSQSFLC